MMFTYQFIICNFNNMRNASLLSMKTFNYVSFTTTDTFINTFDKRFPLYCKFMSFDPP